MASTTVNGVVLELPYAIIRNFREVRPYSIGVVNRDGITRKIAVNDSDADLGIFVYGGDKIIFELQAPANANNTPLFDVIRVNPSSGAETLDQVVAMPAFWMRRLQATVSAINPTTGAVTLSAEHS